MSRGEDLLKANLHPSRIGPPPQQRQLEADLAYTNARAAELAEAIHAFLKAMRAAGSPGLQRPPSHLFGAKSWENWIYADGRVSDWGPKLRKPPEQYALEMLSKRPRDGWVDRQRDVRICTDGAIRKLAGIMNKHNVSL